MVKMFYVFLYQLNGIICHFGKYIFNHQNSNIREFWAINIMSVHTRSLSLLHANKACPHKDSRRVKNYLMANTLAWISISLSQPFICDKTFWSHSWSIGPIELKENAIYFQVILKWIYSPKHFLFLFHWSFVSNLLSLINECCLN